MQWHAVTFTDWQAEPKHQFCSFCIHFSQHKTNVNNIHTLSVEAFLTLRTLTPLGKWNSWFSKSVLKNVFWVRGSVKDMPTSLTTDVLSFSTLSLELPCWNTTWGRTNTVKEKSCWSIHFKYSIFSKCLVLIVSSLCSSLGYCCLRWPGPGPCGLRLCSCAVGERCPCLPSVWSAAGRSHETPCCHSHSDQCGSLSISPVLSEEQWWKRFMIHSPQPSFRVNCYAISFSHICWGRWVLQLIGLLTMRLIRARRKRRMMMQTAMFPLRPLSPVLWRRSSSMGT